MQIMLILLAPILAIALLVFWQALMLFFATKILKVAESTYGKAVKIVLWMMAASIPILIVHFLMKLIKLPLAGLLGGLLMLILVFVAANFFYGKYYHTGFGKNLGIFVLSQIINSVLGLILALIILVPLGMFVFSNAESEGGKSSFHFDKSFKESIEQEINFGKTRIRSN